MHYIVKDVASLITTSSGNDSFPIEPHSLNGRARPIEMLYIFARHREHHENMLAYTEHCAACSDQTQTARVYQNADSSPSKHEDSTQCCFNVGPAPLAVGQY